MSAVETPDKRRFKLDMRVVMNVGLALLALVGLYMSWGALYDAAVYVGGYPPERAFFFPFVVDLATVLVMMLVLYSEAERKRDKALPWIAFAIYGLITLAGNAVHVVVADPTKLLLGEAAGVLVNTIPGLSLIIMTHLAATEFKRARKRKQLELAAIAEAEARAAARAVSAANAAARPAPVVLQPARSPGVKRSTSRSGHRAELLSTVLALGDSGKGPSEIALATGVPKATVSRWIINETEKRARAASQPDAAVEK